jgi:hypothetical protein|tara:strand:+ start:1951 stop:2076 length:126 start_codon:yes stop_codon:yes gene_type:complete
MTLAQFAQTILRPATLRMIGLPDTKEGNAALDKIVEEMRRE